MSQEPKISFPELQAKPGASPAPPRAEPASDTATQERLIELEKTTRQLLAARHFKEPRIPVSKLAVVAVVLSLAALLCCAALSYHSWSSFTASADFNRSMPELTEAVAPNETQISDPRTQLRLAELARRAPTIRSGTLQAWWAGEQARQVQRLEQQAKRQLLSGDREGAARSVGRADAIRSAIGSLADYEKPPSR